MYLFLLKYNTPNVTFGHAGNVKTFLDMYV